MVTDTAVSPIAAQTICSGDYEMSVSAEEHNLNGTERRLEMVAGPCTGAERHPMSVVALVLHTTGLVAAVVGPFARALRGVLRRLQGPIRR
jgi:hypothetical protein